MLPRIPKAYIAFPTTRTYIDKAQAIYYNYYTIKQKGGTDMIVVNTDYIEGKTLEMLGLVNGSTIQSKNIGKDFGAGLKSIVGGELTGYTEMMEEARSIAERRMLEKAAQMNADAVVNVRYATSAIMQGASEVMVYGTAVKFK